MHLPQAIKQPKLLITDRLVLQFLQNNVIPSRSRTSGLLLTRVSQYFRWWELAVFCFQWEQGLFFSPTRDLLGL